MASSRKTQAKASKGTDESQTTIAIQWPDSKHLDVSSLTELVRVALPSLCHNGQPGSKTWGQFLVERLLNQAGAGDLRALKEIWIRVDGKPGTHDLMGQPPVEIDDELARLIIEYDANKSDRRTETMGGTEV